MARNKYPGRCYCCGKWIEPGYGHFERVRGASLGQPKWRIKCVQCASGRVLTDKDLGVVWAKKAAGQGQPEVSNLNTSAKIPNAWDFGWGEERMPINNEFPKRLRKLRESRGMNRKALGECCGLSKNIIGKYERGERRPTVASLERIADFFSVTTDHLLGREKIF